jgi:23S rRNA pseudouridine1911/1915/1917 synthase
MKIEELFKNENFVVINKPSGLVIHSDGKTKEETLINWILENYPEIKDVGEKLGEVERPGIVHRLDRETSGVIIITRTQEAYDALKKQFQNREVNKTYKAFVYGKVKNDSGIIDRPIARSASDFRKWSAQRGSRGKEREALTEYSVIERGEEYSYLELQPKTGRTHQIRVHLKAINYPVICDKLYAPKRECALGFNRLALHSESIEFSGLKGEKIKVEAPLPEDFQKALKYIAG